MQSRNEPSRWHGSACVGVAGLCVGVVGLCVLGCVCWAVCWAGIVKLARPFDGSKHSMFYQCLKLF